MSDDKPGLGRRAFLSATMGGLAAGSILAASRGAFAAKAGAPASETDQATGGGTLIPEAQQKPLGVCVVGLGKRSVGEILPSLLAAKRCEVTALVSGDARKARSVAKAYNVPDEHIYSYKTFDAIKDDPSIDIVYIAVPNVLHAEFAVRAAAAQKHVLCETPMAGSVADAERMIAASLAAKKWLMVGYQSAYEPYIPKMIGMVKDATYGPLQQITCDVMSTVGELKQWRLDAGLAGGGCMLDAVASLSALRMVANQPIERVSAVTYKNPFDKRFKAVEGSINYQLRLATGALISGNASYASAPVNRLQAVGTQGTCLVEAPFALYGQRFVHGKDSELTELRLGRVQGSADQFDHLAACIEKDVEPLTSGKEALLDMKLVQLIYQAAHEGRAVTI